MFPQTLTELGFREEENEELPSRGYKQIKDRQREGFIPGERVWAGYALWRTWHAVDYGVKAYIYLKKLWKDSAEQNNLKISAGSERTLEQSKEMTKSHSAKTHDL